MTVRKDEGGKRRECRFRDRNRGGGGGKGGGEENGGLEGVAAGKRELRCSERKCRVREK